MSMILSSAKASSSKLCCDSQVERRLDKRGRAAVLVVLVAAFCLLVTSLSLRLEGRENVGNGAATVAFMNASCALSLN
ncbi:hypothetical protein G6F42_028703 [Rhizopus arrhizus]|nr:hypothetical protein G6F42_028703 [Rhizopus arrhizus]